MYQRTTSIERAVGDGAGLISGILATNGEAADGHILNIDGAELPDRAPLLFGHDAYTGTGNLGSWTSFAKYGKGKQLGSRGIRGQAQIELDGEGDQAAWRADINFMIERGHIGSFSVRWEETEEPVYRVNLPSDHPAFVDSKIATGRQRWGLYFDKWRLLEGSVVTLGADPAALVGRLQESQGDVRQFWRSAINDLIRDPSCRGHENPAPGLVAIQLDGGDQVYVERVAYDAMLEDANANYLRALDILESALEAREDAQEQLTAALNFRSEGRPEVEPDDGDEPTGPQEEARSDGAERPAETEELLTPRDVANALRDGLARASRRLADETREDIRRLRGEVPKR